MLASLLGFAALIGLGFFGVPLGLAMIVIGFVGFGLIRGWPASLEMVGQIILDTGMSYDFSVLPMFVLMGAFIYRAALSEELYDASHAWLGHWRGGLALATVAACAGFSAVSGSSVATAATIAKVAMPAMRRYRYADGLAAGTIAAGGTLGILIPPSVALVLYGILTSQDIGALFIGGILPGLLTVVLYMTVIATATRLNPAAGPPGARSSWTERWRATTKVWGVVILFLYVLGGIYAGLFTPTEAGGMGAAGALAFAVLRRRLGWRGLLEAAIEAGRTTAMIFTVGFGALILSNFVNVAGMPATLVAWLQQAELSPLAAIIGIVAIYLLLGCLLDGMAMILLTVPIFAPVVAALGFDLVWFGILVVILAEVSMITPPVGLNVFVLRSVLTDVPLWTIFRGVAPFLVADVTRIGLIIAFPGIVLLLPGLMR